MQYLILNIQVTTSSIFFSVFDHIASENEYVVFWMGWNENATDILHELQDEQLIHKEPGNLTLYLESEYGLDSYIVSAGERFWGGTTSLEELAKVRVIPCRAIN